jgi:hypothetical protein
MRKTRLRPVLNRGSTLWTKWWLKEVVELNGTQVGRGFVVFVIVGFGDVEVNGPPGRNVNNFTIVAIRRSFEQQNKRRKLTGELVFYGDQELKIGGGPRVRFPLVSWWSPSTDQQR